MLPSDPNPTCLDCPKGVEEACPNLLVEDDCPNVFDVDCPKVVEDDCPNPEDVGVVVLEVPNPDDADDADPTPVVELLNPPRWVEAKVFDIPNPNKGLEVPPPPPKGVDPAVLLILLLVIPDPPKGCASVVEDVPKVVVGVPNDVDVADPPNGVVLTLLVPNGDMREEGAAAGGDAKGLVEVLLLLLLVVEERVLDIPNCSGAGADVVDAVFPPKGVEEEEEEEDAGIPNPDDVLEEDPNPLVEVLMVAEVPKLIVLPNPPVEDPNGVPPLMVDAAVGV